MALKNTVSGFNSCYLESKSIRLKKGAVHYGLLPVYLLNTKCGDKKYAYAVNGQTGKVVGELPMSGKKRALRFLLRFLLSGAVVFGIAYAVMFLI